MTTSYTIQPIGYVESPRLDPETAPKLGFLRIPPIAAEGVVVAAADLGPGLWVVAGLSGW